MKIFLLIAFLAIGGPSAALRSGVPVPTGDASFFVLIRRENRPKCGGALISKNHVLTAENCVVNEQHQRHPGVSVLIATDLENADAAGRQVLRVRLPPNVKGASTREMSVALLILSESIPSYENVAPISLPTEDLPAAKRFKSPPSLSAQLIVLSEIMDPFSSEPLQQLQVSVKRCKGSDLLCGKPSAVAMMTPVVEGSPLVRNGTLIGIDLGRRTKDGKKDMYAEVHKYWVFIFESMYTTGFSNARKQNRKFKLPRLELNY